MRDPVTTWALTLGGTIRWSSRLLPDPFGVFRHAAQHGLKFGASVATGPISSLTLCSLARGDRELTDAEIGVAKAVVTGLHAMSELPRSLTDDQRATLACLDGSDGPRRVARHFGEGPDDAGTRIRALCETLLARSPDEAIGRARANKLF